MPAYQMPLTTDVLYLLGASAARCGEESQQPARPVPDGRRHALRGAPHRRGRGGQAATLNPHPDPNLDPNPNPNQP